MTKTEGLKKVAGFLWEEVAKPIMKQEAALFAGQVSSEVTKDVLTEQCVKRNQRVIRQNPNSRFPTNSGMRVRVQPPQRYITLEQKKVITKVSLKVGTATQEKTLSFLDEAFPAKRRAITY